MDNTFDMKAEFDQSQYDLTQIVEEAVHMKTIESSQSTRSLGRIGKYFDDKDMKICIYYGVNPPTYDDAVLALTNLEMPPVVNREPFYGNHNDLTAKKEIGQTVLQIGGNSLNDLTEYDHWVADPRGIENLRVANLKEIYGAQFINDMLKKVEGGVRFKEDHVREMVASEKEVIVTSAMNPPCQFDANRWINTKFFEERAKNQKSAVEPSNREEPSSTSQLSESRQAVKENEQNLSAIVAQNDLVNVTKILDASSMVHNRQRGPERQKLNTIDLNATTISLLDDDDDEMVFKNRSSLKNSQTRRLSIKEDQTLEVSSMNNTLGFKVELENLQNARATTEVSDRLKRKTCK